MNILDIVKLNEDAMIRKLKELETLDYRKNNSKKKIEKEKKIATVFLRSILQRKEELICLQKKQELPCTNGDLSNK